MEILTRVEEGRAFADLALDHALSSSGLTSRDRRLATELSYGVLRWRSRLDVSLQLVSHRPLETLEPWVRNLLRLGAYQCLFLDRVPIHAAVHESVSLARRRGHTGIAQFVNGVLRTLLRQGEASEPRDPLHALAFRHAFPLWLTARWASRYGAREAEALMTAFNQRPSWTIRVNTLRSTREELMHRIKGEGVVAFPTRYAPDGLSLEHPLEPDASPSYQEGLWVVQDEASILIGHLLAPSPGESILDLCSAPGGKATHLAQLMENRGRIVAVDPHRGRLGLLREACSRLGIAIVGCEVGPAQAVRFPGAFDRVLVDAPCSNLGTVRRAPEIKWHRREEDLSRLGALQVEILLAAASHVRPGGVLVYSTCSLEPEENEAVLESFLSDHPEFKLDLGGAGESAAPFVTGEGIFRTWPHHHGMDGFTAFRLVKGGLP